MAVLSLSTFVELVELVELVEGAGWEKLDFAGIDGSAASITPHDALS